jgi:phosphinothricin acetyltransferase
VLIRDATPADLPAINAIYNALIPTHTVTWTEEPATLQHHQEWFEGQRGLELPVLVADEAGEVAGFTAYEHFRGEGKWPGYRATMELSIHVRQDRWGRGVGRALLEALVERARSAGVHVLVAAIDGENEASLRFHERLGFVEVARMPQVGQKFGRWLDLVLMQRVMDERPHPQAPSPPGGGGEPDTAP